MPRRARTRERMEVSAGSSDGVTVYRLQSSVRPSRSWRIWAQCAGTSVSWVTMTRAAPVSRGREGQLGHKPYRSDLSDARWALIGPTLMVWRKVRLERRPMGQPAKVGLRDVFDALLYINRTGIPWK